MAQYGGSHDYSYVGIWPTLQVYMATWSPPQLCIRQSPSQLHSYMGTGLSSPLCRSMQFCGYMVMQLLCGSTRLCGPLHGYTVRRSPPWLLGSLCISTQLHGYTVMGPYSGSTWLCSCVPMQLCNYAAYSVGLCGYAACSVSLFSYTVPCVAVWSSSWLCNLACGFAVMQLHMWLCSRLHQSTQLHRYAAKETWAVLWVYMVIQSALWVCVVIQPALWVQMTLSMTIHYSV